MKPARPLKNRLVPVISLLLLAGGCARFEHQTGELEPHAMLLVVDTSDFGGDLGVVKKLDGLPVSAGGEYRLRPGAHVAIIQFVDRFAESYKPASVTIGSKPDAATSTPPVNLDVSETGKASVSGQSPVGGGMQMVNVNVANRRIRYLTNSITVEAGWRYELDGDKLRGVRLRAP
ncbi:MAG: hypothetical protein HY301_16600 [Verrucomicrobia bacterium]|nr:hypothetical protein [Verrucomicrobiota bacterium]